MRDGQDRLVFLYKMSDLPLKRHHTCNYPNPNINAQFVVTQTEGKVVRSLRTIAWQGGSRHAAWYESCGKSCSGMDTLVNTVAAPTIWKFTVSEHDVRVVQTARKISSHYVRRATYNSMSTGHSLSNRVNEAVNEEPVAFNGARRVRRGDGETRWSKGRKVRPVPTLRSGAEAGDRPGDHNLGDSLQPTLHLPNL